jgi:hypothetical protein
MMNKQTLGLFGDSAQACAPALFLTLRSDHNRRRQPIAAFQTLLGLGTGRKPTLINKYAVPRTSPLVRRRPTPSYCVLLKQPDKQKPAY